MKPMLHPIHRVLLVPVVFIMATWGCSSSDGSGPSIIEAGGSALADAFEGDAPGECDNGADEDRDGDFDCDDADCAGAPNCRESAAMEDPAPSGDPQPMPTAGGAAAIETPAPTGETPDPDPEMALPSDGETVPAGGQGSSAGHEVRGEQAATSGGEQAATSGGEQVAPSGGEQAAPSGGEQAAPSGGEQAAPSGGEQAATSGGGEAVPSGGQTDSEPGGSETSDQPPGGGGSVAPDHGGVDGVGGASSGVGGSRPSEAHGGADHDSPVGGGTIIDDPILPGGGVSVDGPPQTGGALDPDDGNAEACLSDAAFMAAEVWPTLLGETCITCHQAGAFAGGTRMLLVESATPDAQNQNLAAVTNVVDVEHDGMPLILLKPTGRHPNGHAGGTLIALDSAEYARLAELVDRITGDIDECGNVASAGGGGGAE